MNETLSAEVRAHRRYIPQSFDAHQWEAIAPWFRELQNRALPDDDALRRWLADWDELESVLQEEGSRRFIRMTCHTDNKAAVERYTEYLQSISPNATEARQELVRKYWDSPLRNALDASRYRVMNRLAENALKLYRKENLELQTQIDVKAQQFSALSGAMTVTLEGKQLTLQQAAAWLERPERSQREQAWRSIAERRKQDRDALNKLFDELMSLRSQVARNAGYNTYTDYRFQELGRFDYDRAACTQFQQAVEQHISPLNARLMNKRAQRLGLPALKPWDTEVNPFSNRVLKPFANGEELFTKTKTVFTRLKPELGNMVQRLADLGHVDLDSRVGKAPGGYNCSLHETGVPFIFMNAAGLHKDVVTMVHECGHAFHSILTHPLPHNTDKEFPSEIAEVASMSMELVTMDHWNVFYPDAEDLRQAKREQLTRVVNLLPWIATVDAFQQWLYDNPNHTAAERADQFAALHQRFHGSDVDWTGLEDYRRYIWHKQIHIFEIPFYYIEYGIAQLGALQLWRNYRQDPQGALDAYLGALALGYSKPLPELFTAAGIRFDFSASMITDLAQFLEQELVQEGLL